MNEVQEKLKSLRKEFPIVTKAPVNFFLAGEHSVMFGELAICQAIPKYVYVGVRKIGGESVHVRPAAYPDPLSMELEDSPLPTLDQCMIEKLLWANGFKGVEIAIVSEAPRGCGLATSGALGAALSTGLTYIFSNRKEREELIEFLGRLTNKERRLQEIIKDRQFLKIWPLAWKLDALFHNHSSSGANPFFALVGSPNGLPAIYKGAHREGNFLPKQDRDRSKPLPLKASNEEYGICEYSQKPECKAPGEKCPLFTTHYTLYDELPVYATDLQEWESRVSQEFFRCAAAICYSGEPKRTGEVIRVVSNRAKALKEMWKKEKPLPNSAIEQDPWQILIRCLGISSEMMLSSLLQLCQFGSEGSQDELFKSIQSVQSKLRSDIGVSCPTIDEICQFAERAGLAAKLTGAGTGGDVVVFGRTKAQLNDFLRELVIKRRGTEWNPTLHFKPSYWADGDFIASPVSFVRNEPRNILFKCDVGESPNRKTVASHINRIKKELLKETNGIEIYPAGDGFVASFTCPEDALEMARRIYKRIEIEVQKPMLRFGVFSGIKDFYKYPGGEEVEEFTHVTHTEETLKELNKENHVLICENTYRRLPQEWREEFEGSIKVRDKIPTYISRKPLNI